MSFNALNEESLLKLCIELQPSEAIRLLKEFLDAHPGSRRAKLHLAFLHYCGYGDGPPAAASLYREILAEDPEDVACLTGLALMQDSPGFQLSAEERIELLSRAADISGDSEAIMNLAYKAWDLDHPSRALEAFKRLYSVARARRQKHLVRIAKESIADIRKGKHSLKAMYSIPEAWAVRSGLDSGSQEDER